MLLPFCPLINPSTDEVDLASRQPAAGCGRGHTLCLVVRRDAPVHLAFRSIAGNQSVAPAETRERSGFSVETQMGLPFRLVRTVTLKAIIRKNRADIAIELDFRAWRLGRSEVR